MPTTQIKRINPLDLQGNIAIGVSLPFNGPVAFKSTYSTQEQMTLGSMHAEHFMIWLFLDNPERACCLAAMFLEEQR